MIKSKICDLLGIKYPIIQGGMAWVADASLAAAVSNAGGLGIITGACPPDIVREEIGKMEKVRTTVDSFPVYKELYGGYALAALVCLLLLLALKLFIRRLP